MKIKTPKAKHLIALALALFMVMPMLAINVRASGTYPGSGTAPYLDIVPTGGATSTSITNIPVQAVGTQFTVDVRVDNYADVNLGGSNNGVSGASYNVVWNPAVLEYVSNVDPGWLPKETDVDTTTSVASGQMTVNQIAFTSTKQSVATSATGSVSEQITFQVLSAGTTALQIQPSGTGVGYLSAPTTTAQAAPSGYVPGTLVYGALYNPQTTVSLLWAPNDVSNQIQPFTGSQNPIDQTFQVDIYINNPLAVPIWGWNLGVTWNPAAVQLTGITEGSYMKPTGTTGTSGADTIFVPGAIDNTVGDIPQGISDVYIGSSYVTTTAASGVLATLTFTVINYADSNINLVQNSGQIQSVMTLNANNQPVELSTLPILNNAEYITPSPPAPVSPVAVISNPDTNPITDYSNGFTITPAFTSNTGTIDLSAIHSVGGTDVVPSPQNSNFLITSYSWTVAQGASLLTIANPTSEAISFTVPTVSSLETFTIQLVVTTASNLGDAAYNPSSAPVTISFTVQPASYAPTTAGALVDVYVNNVVSTATTTQPYYSPNGNNGNPLAYGTSAYVPNAPCDAFGPQEQMNLQALVTYNGAPVAEKEVTFQIVDNHGNVIATLTATTGDNGIASISQRLPWYDATTQNGPTSEFGIWHVYATALVQQTLVSDTMPFDFGDIISITAVTPAAQSLPRSTSTTTTTQSFTVSLSGISAQTQPYYITYTVVDSGSVPVATGMVSGTLAAATYSGTGAQDATGTFTVTPGTYTTSSITFTIPTYAFVGTATINVNVFDANPLVATNNAVPYCPESSATFTISIPYGQ
jgi:hypothetical protein